MGSIPGWYAHQRKIHHLFVLLLPQPFHDFHRQSIHRINSFQAFIAHQRQCCNSKECMERINHVFWSVRYASIMLILQDTQGQHKWSCSLTQVAKPCQSCTQLWDAMRALIATLHSYSTLSAANTLSMQCKFTWQNRMKRVRASWSIQ